jgi:hypothetical protein
MDESVASLIAPRSSTGAGGRGRNAGPPTKSAPIAAHHSFPKQRRGGGLPKTDPILPGQLRYQENVMMMEPVRIEPSVPVASQDNALAKSFDGAWENRAGEASDRTRTAARQLSRRRFLLSPPRSRREHPSSHQEGGEVFFYASARSSTRATCTAARPVPSLIWCRQLVPSATINASPAAARTAGSKDSSPIFIDTS